MLFRDLLLTTTNTAHSDNNSNKMSGECQTKNRNNYDEDDEAPIIALDEGI